MSPGPLPFEIYRSAQRGELQRVVKWLRKTWVDAVCSTPSEGGRPVAGVALLHAAAANGHLEMVRVLLKEGANVDLQTSLGNTALMHAAGHGHLSILLVLLQHSANPDLRSIQGYTALMMAACKGQEACVESLLRAKANTELLDEDGLTALQHASCLFGKGVRGEMQGAIYEARARSYNRLLEATRACRQRPNPLPPAVLSRTRRHSWRMARFLPHPGYPLPCTRTPGPCRLPSSSCSIFHECLETGTAAAPRPLNFGGIEVGNPSAPPEFHLSPVAAVFKPQAAPSPFTLHAPEWQFELAGQPVESDLSGPQKVQEARKIKGRARHGSGSTNQKPAHAIDFITANDKKGVGDYYEALASLCVAERCPREVIVQIVNSAAGIDLYVLKARIETGLQLQRSVKTFRLSKYLRAYPNFFRVVTHSDGFKNGDGLDHVYPVKAPRLGGAVEAPELPLFTRGGDEVEAYRERLRLDRCGADVLPLVSPADPPDLIDFEAPLTMPHFEVAPRGEVGAGTSVSSDGEETGSEVYGTFLEAPPTAWLEAAEECLESEGSTLEAPEPCPVWWEHLLEAPEPRPEAPLPAECEAQEAQEVQEAREIREVPLDREVPDYICPITTEIMTDPVSTSDGFTYERTAISEWLRTKDTSPVTGATLESKTVIPNLSLRSMIRAFVDAQVAPPPPG